MNTIKFDELLKLTPLVVDEGQAVTWEEDMSFLEPLNGSLFWGIGLEDKLNEHGELKQYMHNGYFECRKRDLFVFFWKGKPLAAFNNIGKGNCTYEAIDVEGYKNFISEMFEWAITEFGLGDRTIAVLKGDTEIPIETYGGYDTHIVDNKLAIIR